jgi:hypothetical protein
VTRMDAILPLRARDVARATILLRSLGRHFEELGRLWVVAPARELREVRSALHAFETTLLAETELIPELSPPTRMAGWYRQQLIKLAIAERIATPNYLTLDADVICTRHVTPDELAPDGKGLCHVIEEDLHPHWYAGSSAVLGLRPLRSGILHNVTPAVLSRRAVLDLQAHLESRARERCHRGLRQALRMRWSRNTPSWRSYLITGVPWTEYALYYTFLEATGQLIRHHSPSEQCIYAIQQSIWYADRTRFDAWQAAPLFTGSGAPWFAVVQSNTGLPPARVWAKVSPYIEPA